MSSLELCLRVDEPYLQEIVNVNDNTTMSELLERFKGKINEIDQYMIFWAHFGSDCNMLEFDRERITEPIHKLDITNHTTVMLIRPKFLLDSKVITMKERFKDKDEDGDDDADLESTLLQWMANKNDIHARDIIRDDLVGLITIDIFYTLTNEDVILLLGKKNNPLDTFKVVLSWIKYQLQDKNDDNHILIQSMYTKFKDIIDLSKLSKIELTHYIASYVLNAKDYINLIEKSCENNDEKSKIMTSKKANPFGKKLISGFGNSGFGSISGFGSGGFAKSGFGVITDNPPV